MPGKRWLCGIAATLAAGASSAHAETGCSLGRIAELPVTMSGTGPMIDAKINGTPVRFIADSGAFYSVISPGSAQSLHLSTSGPPGFYIRGINGMAAASIATAKTFTLAGVDIPKVQFIVAGSETGGAGVIGQNILGLGDVEYDLPHGAIRLFKSSGCDRRAGLAYWAKGRDFAMIAIAPRSAQEPHTVGTVFVDGKPVSATFDTGASTSMLSLTAAARIGIRPDSPGVVDGGTTWGFGRRLVRTWIAPIHSLAIGDGEQIQHARIRIGAMDGITDMLIGADFFIAHRVYVDNRNHRLFLTYEGGPVFDLKARYDGPNGPDGHGAPDAPETSATGAGEAERLSRDGAVAMARRDLATAIADFSKAIARSPSEARYFQQRAEAHARNGDMAAARADLDQAIKLAPTDLDALLGRAGLLLHDHAEADARTDLETADRVADPAAMERLALGDLFTEAHRPARAIGQFDRWIKAHPDDVRRPSALNGRCWARALLGQELDAALRDCDAALRTQPRSANFLDSRGMAHLRRGEFAKAIADYDAALASAPKEPWSLYGRGIARRRAGDAAGGKADIDAALAINPSLAADAKDFGIAP